MSLVLAAAGQGSRMGELTRSRPKALIEEPVQGRAILSHIYERMQQATQLKHIVIVGAGCTAINQQLVEFTRNFPFNVMPEIHLVQGERLGVGYAFQLGVQRLLALGERDAYLSIADGVARSYRQLAAASSLCALGVTRPVTDSSKSFTSLQVNAQGFVCPADVPTSREREYISRGVMRLQGAAIAEYSEIFSSGAKNRLDDPRVRNKHGEFKVTWVWREMQEQGREIQACDLGAMAEVNFAEDLQKFRQFFDEQQS